MIESITSEFESLTHEIIQVLRKYPEARSNDKLLLRFYYREFCGVDIDFTFLAKPASIIRARRLIQKRNPDFKGSPEVEAVRESHSKDCRRLFGQDLDYEESGNISQLEVIK